MKKKVVAGIDIGGTNTRIGLIGQDGKVLIDSNIATDKYPTVEGYISAIYNSIDLLMNNPNLSACELTGIGIGAPNANFHTGCIEKAANLPWQDVPLKLMLGEYFPNLKIKVTNDANAVAIAEMVYGKASKLKDFVVITLGTGLGSGIVANGELVYGHDGLAGEVGHITAVPNGRNCNCGRQGCLETYVSAPGLKRTVFELLANSTEKSLLRNSSFEELTSINIHAAALENDPIALQAFEITGEILGRSLADVVAFTSPSAIFIFGGLAEAKEMIINPAKEYMEKYLLPCFKGKVSLLSSELGNKDAGVIGGAALVWKDYI
ncbi:MAG: ROK family protein [Prevotellaceae bacterium]|jgi:glucokinase|nr:ROK family protein [Prevotellaceae bacterium]